jgi:hypothetical protein
VPTHPISRLSRDPKLGVIAPRRHALQAAAVFAAYAPSL